ncbi:MAG: Lrp/AsnC family transcriptional regulator [bacterium]
MNDQSLNLSKTEQKLLNDFQRDFPLHQRPFDHIAKKLGITEQEVIEMLKRLKAGRMVTRVGPVFTANRIGVSTLAAVAADPVEITKIAGMINRYPEVNHNYEREHKFNLWFVVTAATSSQLQHVVEDIELKTGLKVLVLPMLKDYYIDLGFPIEWSDLIEQ